jgi:hypothetical protein
MEKLEPNLVMFLTEIVLPKRPMSRILKLEPIRTWLKMLTALPIRAKFLRLMLELK